MSTPSLTISTLLRNSPIDSIEAELLVAHVIGKPREFVVTHPEYPVAENRKYTIENMIRRRTDGEPLAYILGTKEFFGREFFVTSDTLIPRPETETLVEEILKKISSSPCLPCQGEVVSPFTLSLRERLGETGGIHANKDSFLSSELIRNPSASLVTSLASDSDKTRHLPFAGEEIIIIDVGTGSGCISISLALEIEQLKIKNLKFKIFGIDISSKTLRVAKRNAKKFHMEKNISFLKSDLLKNFPLPFLSPVACHMSPVFIIANLPYVSTPYLKQEKTKLTEGIFFEPMNALDGGEDGFDLYRTLLVQIQKMKKDFPKTTICCFFEIGNDQKVIAETAIKKIFPNVKISLKNDLSGQVRVVSFSL